jgi:hypothetical protein
MDDLNKNYGKFNKQLTDANDTSALLKQVLQEMEKGLTRDYVGKDQFIVDEMDDLTKIDQVLKTLVIEREMLSDSLKQLNEQKFPSIMQCDVQEL